MITNDTTFAYNLRREILEDWVHKGHEVFLIAQILNFSEEFERMGVRIYAVHTGRRNTNPVEDLKLMKTYFRILKGISPDYVFTNNIKPNVYAGLACRMLGIRYISNITGLGQPVENRNRLQPIAVALYRLGVSGASCIFFQNQENYQFFCNRRMIPSKAQVCMLPGSGVNLQTHPLLPYPETEMVYFLYIARILKEKGIDQLLFAAEKLKEKHVNVEFHICGLCDDEAYLSVLKDYSDRGIVTYHGEQKDMRPFFEKASCIVHPSYYPEGMSNILLEAAACGRPILATNRSGCREVVEDRVNGYLVPVKDGQAVADALEEFLSRSIDERREMGLCGREKMEREFDRRTVVEQYNRVIGLREEALVL